MSSQKNAPTGPVEAGPWPTRLPAHALTPGAVPRIHGYALHEDIAVHYDFGEYILLALTGRAPSQTWGHAVNLALTVLAASSVADAPVHAATLARRCGADARSVLSTGMSALAEEAFSLLHDDHGTTSEDSKSATALFEQLGDDVRAAVGSPPSSPRALALELLERAGLTDSLQRMAALCLARLPGLVAEARATSSGDVRTYPMQLPEFDYLQDPQTDDS